MNAHSLRPPQAARPGARLARLAGLLLALGTAASPLLADEALGRLFFTPERRQALERQRLYNIQDTSHATEEPVVTLNGIVRRSSGKGSAWINGMVQHDREDISGLQVRPDGRHPGRATLKDLGNDSSTSLGVGAMLRHKSNADADADRRANVISQVVRRRYGVRQSLAQLRRLLAGQALCEHDKFIAANARRDIRRAQ